MKERIKVRGIIRLFFPHPCPFPSREKEYLIP
jgi:hypothetical protein